MKTTESKKSEEKSNCCNAPMGVATGGEGTCCWMCSKCGKPCDPTPSDTESGWEKRADKILRTNQFIKKDAYGEYSDFYLEDLKRFISSEIKSAVSGSRKAMEREFIAKSPAILPPKIKDGYLFALKVFQEVLTSLEKDK